MGAYTFGSVGTLATGTAPFPYEALTIADANCLVIIAGIKAKTATTDGATINTEAGFTRIAC